MGFQKQTAEGTARHPRLLLAEDSEDDAFLFRRSLGEASTVEIIWHAKDGQETMRYLSGEGVFVNRERYPFPDVLVLDLKMPNMNGFEVLERIKGKFPRLTIGVLSTSDDPKDIERAQTLGAHLYEMKNYTPAVLGRFVHFLERMGRMEGSSESM